ncbi:alkaline phosphatase family protein [bacterium]|nr:alkaline phosphatase family protein [bacterium]MCI0607055.1 alkaline phosphatase family protein [bacterium]
MTRVFSAALLALFLFTGCRASQKSGVEGFWIGAFSTQGRIQNLPAKLNVRGDATCVVLRHPGSKLTIELEGTYSKGSTVRILSAGKNVDIPVKGGRFRHRWSHSSNELAAQAWLRFQFSQPDLVIDYLRFSEGREHPKTLVFALDGATWRVMKKLVKENRLPHIQKLMRNGSYGELISIPRTLSPVVWTSIATGQSPQQHGILDFLDKKKRPVHSGQIRTKRIWNILSEKSSLTIGVIGWFVTWPVESVNGFMISDRAIHSKMSDRERMLSIYPPEVQSYFESVFESRKQKYVAECKRFTSFPLDPQFEKLNPHTMAYRKHRILNRRLFPVYLQDSAYVEAGLDLYSSFQPDVFFLYLRGIDFSQHSYWFHMKPEESWPPIDPEEVKDFHNIVENYYVYVDEQIGRFLEIAPPDVTALVISDHGFKTHIKGHTGNERAVAYHEREGIYVFSGREFKQNHEQNGFSIYDVCPLVLNRYGLPVASDMAGKVPLELYSSAFPRRESKKIASYGPNNENRDFDSIGTGADREIIEQLKTLGYISE